MLLKAKRRRSMRPNDQLHRRRRLHRRHLALARPLRRRRHPLQPRRLALGSLTQMRSLASRRRRSCPRPSKAWMAMPLKRSSKLFMTACQKLAMWFQFLPLFFYFGLISTSFQNADEIEIEIDALPPAVLRQLWNTVIKPKPGAPSTKTAKSGKNHPATGGVKRKSMDEHVEAQRMRALEARINMFDKAETNGVQKHHGTATV